MTSDLHYVEVPDRLVPPGVASTAERLAEYAASHLRIDTPEVRWITLAGPKHAQDAQRDGKYARPFEHAVNGLISALRPRCIYLEPGATTQTVFHEVRHYWQVLQGWRPFDPENRAKAEADAERFAEDLYREYSRDRADGKVRL